MSVYWFTAASISSDARRFSGSASSHATISRRSSDVNPGCLRSISQSLGTRDYSRLRIGIGRPPGRMDPADFVLRDFSSTERKELDYFVDRAADAAEALVIEGLERAQSTYNS